MRIGIVTGEYPPMQGGVGAYTQILARELQQQGQDIYLFSTSGAQEADLPLTNTIERWNFGSLQAIKQWAITQKLDVVNLQFQTAAYQMSPWIHFLPDFLGSLPVVTTFHDMRFPYLFPKAGLLRTWIVSHLAKRSKGVIVTNHEDQQQLAQQQNVCLIPIGSNILSNLPSSYNPAEWRQRINATNDDFVLAYFGMLNRSKGIETLLESVASLRDHYQLTIKLIMIGARTGTSDPTNQAYAAEIDRRVQDLNLANAVHWTGFLEDTKVVQYLACADAVVLPFVDGASFRRGSLMAAINAACPIITTVPRVHIPEFIHAENMLLVPPQNTDALMQILWNYRSNQVEINARLTQGAAKLAERFNWQQIAANYLKFFQSIL